MKRLLSIIAVAAMVLGNVSLGYAGNPETVNIAITIKHTKSITVSPATLDIKPGETKTTSATVENDGTGIDETVKMTKLEGVPSGFTIPLTRCSRKLHMVRLNTCGLNSQSRILLLW